MSWRLAFAAVAALSLTACAGGPQERYGRFIQPVANPGKVVATELAFARAAQEDGQWTAFADYAADDATLFVPAPVNAKEWLKNRADPARAITWQPHQIWSSCDGTLAISQGAAQWPDGRDGEFLTVWRRQRDGSYLWQANIAQELDRPLEAPDFVSTEVANCAEPVPADQRTVSSERPAVMGQSDDGSLQYAIHTMQGGSTVTLLLWDGEFEVTGPKVFKD